MNVELTLSIDDFAGRYLKPVMRKIALRQVRQRSIYASSRRERRRYRQLYKSMQQ